MTTAELPALLDDSLATARASWSRLEDEKLGESWHMVAGGTTLVSMPRLALLLTSARLPRTHRCGTVIRVQSTMPHACRCPYCERAIYTSGTGLHSFRAALLLHLLRCEKKPAHMTDKELAAVADRSVTEALGTGSVN